MIDAIITPQMVVSGEYAGNADINRDGMVTAPYALIIPQAVAVAKVFYSEVSQK